MPNPSCIETLAGLGEASSHVAVSAYVGVGKQMQQLFQQHGLLTGLFGEGRRRQALLLYSVFLRSRCLVPQSAVGAHCEQAMELADASIALDVEMVAYGARALW